MENETIFSFLPSLTGIAEICNNEAKRILLDKT